MNIGIVCYPTYGGSGVVATELGKFLALRGHKVHFITYNRPVRLGSFYQNISFHEVRVEDYPLFDYPPYESALTSTMVDVARYQNLDLFHVHYAIPHAAAGYLAKQILASLGKQVPVITTLHGTDITLVGRDKSYEPVVSFSVDQSDGVTAVSDFLRRATYEAFSVRKEIEVIPNFVDTERFRRQDKEHFRRMIAPAGEKLIVHTSNFRKVKRVEDVVLAFREIVAAMPAKLLMVGDGPERHKAEDLCRELGIYSHVVFVGNQNPVEEIYSIADLFLMPSESESFGLAALEAMACGVPVITSNSGGLPELNVDAETGFACPVGDSKTMAEKSIYILSDAARWSQFSERARERAVSFSPENIIPMYESYYRKVVDRQKALQL